MSVGSWLSPVLKARLIYKYLPGGKALRNSLSDILHRDHRPVHMHRQIWHVHEPGSRDVLCLPVLCRLHINVVTVRLQRLYLPVLEDSLENLTSSGTVLITIIILTGQGSVFSFLSGVGEEDTSFGRLASVSGCPSTCTGTI